MRIAVISSIYKRTPPPGYGGIERVVYTLTEELVRGGHDVILFATPGSYCSGKTVEVTGYDSSKAPSGIHGKASILSEEPLYTCARDYLKQHPVDVIHDWSFQNLFVMRHPEKFPFVISTCIPQPPGYKRTNLVACSKAHAALFGGSTKHVHYGLNLEQWEYSYSKKPHFIHISKIAKYKGQHLTIKAARKAGKELLIAGNIEDKFYYYSRIKPLLMISPNIKYIGEIQGTNQDLKEAMALIQAPLWFDAFPLVVLEAFASGTPVISFAKGGISEQIVNGFNGFLCATPDELAAAMKRINEIDPRSCRAYAEEYFSVSRMAADYIKLYERVINGESW